MTTATADLSLVWQITDGIIATVVPILVGILIGWLVKIFPALSSLLTAQRITAGENAIANIVTADLHKVEPGKITVSAAVAARVNDLSASLQSALAKQGTTAEQFASRVTGNVLSSIAPQIVAPAIATPKMVDKPPGAP